MTKKKAKKTFQPRKKCSGSAPPITQASPRSSLESDLNQSDENLTANDEILTAIVEFIDAFYWVFHLEWAGTKRRIANAEAHEPQNNWFGKEGTFAKPTVGDANRDWASWKRLLSTYNKILGILQELEERAEQAGEFSYHLHTIAFDPPPPLVCEE